MKLTVSKNQLAGLAPEQWLRRAGYAMIRGRGGELSFVRRLSNGFYPRFHLYFTATDQVVNFNLHLDQKQASYEGITRHSGEYDGELVEREMLRLKGYLVDDLFA